MTTDSDGQALVGRVYLDSSALVKRTIREAESGALNRTLTTSLDRGVLLVTSALAVVEVNRALRRRPVDAGDDAHTAEAIEVVRSGVYERPITAEVLSLAAHLGPDALRSLDAIHLATAVLLAVDVVVTYDDRLARACRHNGFTTVAPGR